MQCSAAIIACTAHYHPVLKQATLVLLHADYKMCYSLLQISERGSGSQSLSVHVAVIFGPRPFRQVNATLWPEGTVWSVPRLRMSLCTSGIKGLTHSLWVAARDAQQGYDHRENTVQVALHFQQVEPDTCPKNCAQRHSQRTRTYMHRPGARLRVTANLCYRGRVKKRFCWDAQDLMSSCIQKRAFNHSEFIFLQTNRCPGSC